MDNLTHSLVGALIGQAGLKKKTGLAMPALIIGANLPDIDATCTIYGIESLAMRRGLTHGPPAMLLLPLVLAGALWWFDRWQAKRGKRPESRAPVHFGWLYGLSFLACLTHPALDWLNVYGVRLLEPFSSEWFYGDTLFIIDVWLWALMIFATWFSLRRESKGGEWMKPARIAIAVTLGYIGLNGAISQRASEDVARLHATTAHGAWVIASPTPLKFWERETIRSDVHYSANLHPTVRYRLGSWSILSGVRNEVRIPSNPCQLVPLDVLSNENREVDAFMFWSRALFLEASEDGSVILRDARFYDPLARDRFSVPLPDVKCEPLPESSP